MDNTKKILIAIEDGPTSEKVALKGYALAQKLDAKIGIVSVVDNSFLLTDGGITQNELVEVFKNDFKKMLSRFVQKIFKDSKVTSFVEAGKPSDVILKVAKEWGADFIVLGTHARKGVSHLLMGSVAEMVIRNSLVPLYVIPTHE